MPGNVNSAEDDMQLVGLLKQRSLLSAGILYDRYAAALFGIISRIASNQQMAEEILQKVFIKAWCQVPLLNTSGISITTWLINLARQSAFDALKAELLISGAGKPLWSAGDTTTYREQSVFHLICYCGLTFTESAAALGVPVNIAIQQLRTTFTHMHEKN